MSYTTAISDEKENSETREYYATLKGQIFLAKRVLISLLIGLLCLTIVLWVSNDPIMWFFILCSILFLCAYFGRLTRIKERLVLSPKWIEYYGINYSVRVSWEKISELFIENELAGKQEYIKVNYSDVKLLSQRIKAIPRIISIPLSCFSDNWRDSELGQQIKQHAPHLFEREKSA